jgi:hypothetical protein
MGRIAEIFVAVNALLGIIVFVSARAAMRKARKKIDEIVGDRLPGEEQPALEGGSNEKPVETQLAQMEAELERLEAEFLARGGRGPELADQIDRLRRMIDDMETRL